MSPSPTFAEKHVPYPGIDEIPVGSAEVPRTHATTASPSPAPLPHRPRALSLRTAHPPLARGPDAAGHCIHLFLRLTTFPLDWSDELLICPIGKTLTSFVSCAQGTGGGYSTSGGVGAIWLSGRPWRPRRRRRQQRGRASGVGRRCLHRLPRNFSVELLGPRLLRARASRSSVR